MFRFRGKVSGETIPFGSVRASRMNRRRCLCSQSVTLPFDTCVHATEEAAHLLNPENGNEFYPVSWQLLYPISQCPSSDPADSIKFRLPVRHYR